MSKLRPFMPVQMARPGSVPATAPRLPGSQATSPPLSTVGRPYSPRQLDADSPGIDLQALLDAAQEQVNTLQTQNAAQTATFEEERSKFHGAVKVLEESRARACRILARDAVALAVEIGHALAGRAFELDQAGLVSLLESTLVDFSADNPVRVRVSPSDMPHVKAHLERPDASSVQLDVDPALSPGDLCVEAEQLVVDARLSERVATMRDELRSAVRSDEALEEASDDPQPAEATE